MLLTVYNYLPVDYPRYYHDLVARWCSHLPVRYFDDDVYVPKKLVDIVSAACADYLVTNCLDKSTSFYICTNRFTLGYRFSVYYYPVLFDMKRIFIGSYHFRLATEI